MKPLMRAFTYNWPLKLTSLGLAILLWLIVLVKTNAWTTRPFEARVEGWQVSEGLQIISITPPSVRITLAGRRNRVEQVDPELLRVRAALQGRSEGDHQVLVSTSATVLPHGVEVVRTAARTVVVSLDRTVQQKRAVKIVQRGRPAPGFVPVRNQARPNEVTVVGPQSTVRDVATAVAEVDVSGIQETTTFTCILEARDARNMPVSGVRLNPSRADVEIVVDRVNTKTVPVVLGRLLLPAGREVESIEVSPQVITLTGKPDALAAVDHVRTKPVPLTGSVTQVRAELDVPEGLKPVGDDSVRVSVQLIGPRAPAVTRPPTRPTPDAGPPSADDGTGDDEEPAEPEPPEPPEPEPPGTPDEGPGGEEPDSPGGDDRPGPAPE